jgi:hypothetical protein
VQQATQVLRNIPALVAGMPFAEHENSAKMSPIQKMFVDVQQQQWVCFLLQLLATSGSKP